MSAIDDELSIYTDEDERRLEMLRHIVRKYETLSSTLAAATKLKRCIRRKA